MLSRRQLLKLGITGAAVGSAASLVGCRSTSVGKPGPSPPDFSVAFLTDPHVFADKGAPRGCRSAFEHAVRHERPPELLITGGDLAFDIMETSREQADAQYDLFDRSLEGIDLPIHHTIGNHDCLGVAETGVVPVTDPLFGKEYFRRRFGLERLNYSFDHEGWHFVILDTIGIQGRSYRGWVDEEQIAWLDDDLAASGKPTVVIGHIPLFSNFIEWRKGTSEAIPAGVSVVNAHEVAKVLVKHPVKLVLAGHLHVNETFLYKGIEFANVGAVSGNWWDGIRDGFQEGYTFLSFRGNQVERLYVDYGWEVPEATETSEAPA